MTYVPPLRIQLLQWLDEALVDMLNDETIDFDKENHRTRYREADTLFNTCAGLIKDAAGPYSNAKFGLTDEQHRQWMRCRRTLQLLEPLFRKHTSLDARPIRDNPQA